MAEAIVKIGEAGAPMPVPAIWDDVQRHLGRELQLKYAEMVLQPVPDRIRILLEGLERVERAR